MTSLTDRILPLLSTTPATSANIWDALGDPGVRRSDVVSELSALCDEGRAVLSATVWGAVGYCRAEVAS